ncbi:unnamed protein product [Callosobruchus maculatus]|uniref:Uncharacterized protein n=1 Tax=Callosobruchus maculatus TaxID=64391 RepID=A0A653DFP4_CALMS|nr:unnamed protein product [Callosobruchus maculatus]VEN59025.1 unnamed protein product [Callosobruchus maculatus]
MEATDNILNAAFNTINPVPEMMKIHQATWLTEAKMTLNCRFLSCVNCRSSYFCPDNKTVHHEIVKAARLVEQPTLGESTSEQNSTLGESTSTTDVKCLTRTTGRLRYSDIYSDDDSDDPTHDFTKHDFVVIRIVTKKSFKHYVGQVCEVYGDGDLDVKFLRKTQGGKFVFPPVEDLASVNHNDVVQALQHPQVHRGAYTFRNDLSAIVNLN